MHRHFTAAVHDTLIACARLLHACVRVPRQSMLLAALQVDQTDAPSCSEQSAAAKLGYSLWRNVLAKGTEVRVDKAASVAGGKEHRQRASAPPDLQSRDRSASMRGQGSWLRLAMA